MKYNLYHLETWLHETRESIDHYTVAYQCEGKPWDDKDYPACACDLFVKSTKFRRIPTSVFTIGMNALDSAELEKILYHDCNKVEYGGKID